MYIGISSFNMFNPPSRDSSVTLVKGFVPQLQPTLHEGLDEGSGIHYSLKI